MMGSENSMDDLDILLCELQKFEKTINLHQHLSVHEENRFNKQFGEVLRDWEYLRIIHTRLANTNSEKIAELTLDLKSLYVFGRVFSESILFLTSLFYPNTAGIKWNKIGDFVNSVEMNLSRQSHDFKHMWTELETPIRNLNSSFRYRNELLHQKESMTEWTFTLPGQSNLDYVSMARVPWPEDNKNSKSESVNARKLIQNLAHEVPKILRYLLTKND